MNTSADSKSGIRNYDEALAQIREAGIAVDRLEFGKITRYHVGEERKRRAWTRLSLVPSRSGQGAFVVGSFGVFQGDDPVTQQIRITSGDPNYDCSMTPHATKDDQRRPLIRRFAYVDESTLDDLLMCIAATIEDSLIQAGAVPGKDYSVLDLYKLAQPFALHIYQTSGEIAYKVSWDE